MAFLRTFLFAFASLIVAVSATQSLSSKVSGPAAVNGVDNLKVVATVTNTGDETLKILNDPRGPLSTRPTDTFSVTDTSGARPAFTGIKLKYVPKTAVAVGAFTVLAPGESVQVEHALGQAYNFSQSGAGTYDIHANNAFLIINEDDSVSTIHADSQAHTTKLTGELAVVRPMPGIARRAVYNGCTSAQQTTLDSAVKAAQSYALSTYSYASNHSYSTNRYTTWFGTFTTANYKSVLSHFTNINSNTFSSFDFDCTCTDSGTYAYVYPDSFGTIYLCGAFWNAPTTGTDSKGGTLIHESSHFTRNGGTDDYSYGQTASMLLAKSDPQKAILNADSHEYYAENNPALA